ncbi:MAG: LysM domain-containing protein [Bacillota bacterium]|jgi:hypothetical protein
MYNEYYQNMPEGECDYTLAIGETLEEVAEDFGITVEEIVELNPELTAEQYRPGRRIRVPYRRYWGYDDYWRYRWYPPYPIRRYWGRRPRRWRRPY